MQCYPSRQTVTISQDEYDRLRDAEIRLRSYGTANPQTITITMAEYQSLMTILPKYSRLIIREDQLTRALAELQQEIRIIRNLPDDQPGTDSQTDSTPAEHTQIPEPNWDRVFARAVERANRKEQNHVGRQPGSRT